MARWSQLPLLIELSLGKSIKRAAAHASCGLQWTLLVPTQSQSQPIRDRALFWKPSKTRVLKFFTQWNWALQRYPVRDRPSCSGASALQFPAKLCILCNCHSPAGPHSPPGLQVRLHYIRICTKKGRKARRREGDKCFFLKFLFPRRYFYSFVARHKYTS